MYWIADKSLQPTPCPREEPHKTAEFRKTPLGKIEATWSQESRRDPDTLRLKRLILQT